MLFKRFWAFGIFFGPNFLKLCYVPVKSILTFSEAIVQQPMGNKFCLVLTKIGILSGHKVSLNISGQIAGQLNVVVSHCYNYVLLPPLNNLKLRFFTELQFIFPDLLNFLPRRSYLTKLRHLEELVYVCWTENTRLIIRVRRRTWGLGCKRHVNLSDYNKMNRFGTVG